MDGLGMDEKSAVQRVWLPSQVCAAASRGNGLELDRKNHPPRLSASPGINHEIGRRKK
jgi:hypothetical protein